MKKLLVLGMILASSKSFACNNIVGTWKCVNDQTGIVSTESFKILSGGIMQYSENEEGFVTNLLMGLNGSSQPLNLLNTGDNNVAQVKVGIICNGNSVLSSVKASSSKSDETGSTITEKLVITTQGNVNGKSYKKEVKTENFIVLRDGMDQELNDPVLETETCTKIK